MSYGATIARLGAEPLRVPYRTRAALVKDGAAMMWRGMSKGKTFSEMHGRGIDTIASGYRIAGVSDDAVSSVTGFVLNVFHVILLLAGGWMVLQGLGLV